MREWGSFCREEQMMPGSLSVERNLSIMRQREQEQQRSQQRQDNGGEGEGEGEVEGDPSQDGRNNLSPPSVVILESSSHLEHDIRRIAAEYKRRPRSLEFEYGKGKGGLGRDELREIEEDLLALADAYIYG